MEADDEQRLKHGLRGDVEFTQIAYAEFSAAFGEERGWELAFALQVARWRGAYMPSMNMTPMLDFFKAATDEIRGNDD